MKKKYIVTVTVAALLAVGIILVLLSLILAVHAAAQLDIIGGSSSMFSFVFFHSNGGIYAILASLGGLFLIASLVVGLLKKTKP